MPCKARSLTAVKCLHFSISPTICYKHAHSASAFKHIRCRIQSVIFVVVVIAVLLAAAAANGIDRQGAGVETTARTRD